MNIELMSDFSNFKFSVYEFSMVSYIIKILIDFDYDKYIEYV